MFFLFLLVTKYINTGQMRHLLLMAKKIRVFSADKHFLSIKNKRINQHYFMMLRFH